MILRPILVFFSSIQQHWRWVDEFNIEVPADPMSGEGPPPGSSTAICLSSPHMVEGASTLSMVSFIRSTNLCPHDLITSQKPHLQILHWGLGFKI